MKSHRELVDSSIWIDFFRDGKESRLSPLLLENLLCTNELILSELIPFAEHVGHFEMIAGLQALEMVPMQIHWEGIRQLQLHKGTSETRSRAQQNFGRNF